MNAIGTQLRDPINSGLTRWRMAVSYGRRRGTREESQVSTRFSLSMEMSRLTRERTAEPLSRDQILRHARGQGNVHFPCSADHEQDWQPYPVDPYSAICDDHTYIHTYIHAARSSAYDAETDRRHPLVGERKICWTGRSLRRAVQDHHQR